MLQVDKKPGSQVVDAVFKAVFALNLDPIKFKLMDKREGHGWSREEADRRELEYKRFLALVAMYPEETIVPDVEVDKFWHGHILDTMKYAEDCQNVFGYFLHHFPYFGMRDDEDAAALSKAAAMTRSLYQKEFGEARAIASAYCARIDDTAGAAYCARIAGKTATYCAAAGSVRSNLVLAKGRPAMQPAAT